MHLTEEEKYEMKLLVRKFFNLESKLERHLRDSQSLLSQAQAARYQMVTMLKHSNSAGLETPTTPTNESTCGEDERGNR